MLKLSLPLLSVLEALYQREVPHRHGADDDAARIAMSSGASRAMRHVPKHQDIELKLFKELFGRRRHGPLRRVMRVDTSRNRADILTKAVSGKLRQKHLKFLGFVHVNVSSQHKEILRGHAPPP